MFYKNRAACYKLSFVESGFLRLFATLDDKTLHNGSFRKDTLSVSCLV